MALAVAWSFPLAVAARTHLAGAGFSDNASFLWNFWWMREALGSGERFFDAVRSRPTAPITLHDTALNAFAGRPFRGLSPLAAPSNVTILISLLRTASAPICWRGGSRATRRGARRRRCSAARHLAAHRTGTNLTSATLPLFALAVGMAFEGPARRRPFRSRFAAAITAGVILGATAYIDYYYVVTRSRPICAVLLARDWSVAARGRTPKPRSRVSFGAGDRGCRGHRRHPHRRFDVTIAGVPCSRATCSTGMDSPAAAAQHAGGWRSDHSRSRLAMAASRRRAGDDGRRRCRDHLPTDERRRRDPARRVRVAAIFLAERAKNVDAATFSATPFTASRAKRSARRPTGCRSIRSRAAPGWHRAAGFSRMAVRRYWRERTVRYWTAIGVFFFVWALGPPCDLRLHDRHDPAADAA